MMQAVCTLLRPDGLATTLRLGLNTVRTPHLGLGGKHGSRTDTAFSAYFALEKNQTTPKVHFYFPWPSDTSGACPGNRQPRAFLDD